MVTQGKWLFARTITSTLGGEALDTTLFCLIAFLGQIPFSLLLTVMLSNYIFKCGVEIVFTPVTYVIVNFLKREEKLDPFDFRTNFNPFKLEE